MTASDGRRLGDNNWVTCGCGKQAMRSRPAARAAARRMRRLNGPDGHDGPLRAYLCETGLWHIGHAWQSGGPNLNDPRLRFL